jgi:hypothetical protein
MIFDKCTTMTTVVICSMLVAVCDTAVMTQSPAMKGSDKTPSFPIAQQATALIGPIDGRRLVDDRVFLSTLKGLVASSTFSGEDKADAFALMLRKIGWQFTGSVRIPNGYNYLRIYTGMASTFIGYQQYLSSSGLKSTDLLTVARGQCATHVVRCAHALLLAMLIDPTAGTPVVKSLIDMGQIRAAQVPPILLHHLSLAVVLTRDGRLATAFGALLNQVEWEENQEDILCMLAMFDTSGAVEMTKAFVQSALQTKLDEAVRTAFAVLRRRLTDQEFRAWYVQVSSTASDPARTAALNGLREGNFKSLDRFGPGSDWVKTWDDFSVTTYEDGMSLSYQGVFRDFIGGK